LALLFALSGGAYAAGKFVITSTKQIKPSVLKQLQGKAGAQGLAGAAGAQGPAGGAGKDGTNGKDGANGESVAAKAVSTGDKVKCAEMGGSEYTVAGKTTLICNGKTGFTETLPSGKTETGTWGFVTTAAGVLRVPLSFPIPLAAALSESNLHFVKIGDPTSEACPGSVEEPKAKAGNLCVYAQFEQVPASGEAFVIPRTAGVSLFFEVSEVGKTDEGTWAVTAP
jgi:hypothetical protein